MISGEIKIQTSDPEEYIEKLESGHRIALSIDGCSDLALMRVASVEREEYGVEFTSMSSGLTFKTRPQALFMVTLVVA